ncbi:hypothetical protein NP590_12570 [Methylomonas sp. SURF-2]|uniref:Uncharacterized protein n=1 Tax=Methylomonas subterranea TaxID=2952225 RepID=A0ABT1TI97_9GAMM|nr:hypothetical protein [Methylomonas sp. SURF-2]MCQ8104941.1 hypothetical protein [Methylomonas sp. SURF-2]
MTSILERVLKAVELSRSSADFRISEDPGHLWVGGRLNGATLTAWQAVVDESIPWLTLVCKDETGDSIYPEAGNEGDKFRLDLTFECPINVPHLFSLEGWKALLRSEEKLISANAIKLAFIQNGFESKAFMVEPWVNAPQGYALDDFKSKPFVGPRKYVRCQSSELMAPVSIKPWLLNGSAPDDCPAFAIWQEVASEMLAKSLPNELYTEGDSFKLNLSGQPPKIIDFGCFLAEEIPFQILQDSANWVYLEGEDVEVRHTFLTSELARSWSSDVSFCEGLALRLPGALDSARLVYKAHLRTSSKETLKSLADLRKTLAEEIQKLLQQSKDLSGSVWRDVAIAIGAVAVRYSMPNGKVTEISVAYAGIFILIAMYIGISYWITITTNNNFLRIIEISRESWRTKLYAFLDDNDYQSLAKKPLNDSISAYRKTERRTHFVVLGVICILIMQFFNELDLICLDCFLSKANELISLLIKNVINFITYFFRYY